ncbi:MAG TPA: hypothetical protein VNS19_08010 [Acidimicrobiales bacterium]|nr:hypothetical protein [Acidimicrobiales bacterium]
MQPVHRSEDDELCGHVEERDGRWRALTVFGSELGAHDDRDAAEQQVVAEGLAVLAERWMIRNRDTGEEDVVRIVEAHDGSVTVSFGYYPEPGARTLTLTRDELASGPWGLEP